MTAKAHLVPDQLGEVLTESGMAGATFDGRGSWHGAAGRAKLHFRAGGEWLRLDAEWHGQILAASTDAWRLLLCNDQVPGPARFIAAPEGGAVARADLLLREPSALAPELRALIANIDALFAVGAAAQDCTQGQCALLETADRAGSGVGEAFCDRLAECHWPTVTRPSGRASVELDVPGAFHPAVLEQHGDAVRIEAGLADWPALSALSRQAIALLLLTLSRHVKSVRAVAFAIEGRPAVAFNAWVPVNPSGDEPEAALGALSVACQLAAEETRLLADEGVAREFLASRRWEHEEVSKRKDKTP